MGSVLYLGHDSVLSRHSHAESSGLAHTGKSESRTKKQLDFIKIKISRVPVEGPGLGAETVCV